MRTTTNRDDIQRLKTKMANYRTEMENERKNERKKCKATIDATIDTMKKERERETADLTTLLLDQHRLLMAAIAQPVSTSTTQPNQNPMTDVNQTTAADTVPLFRRHSKLSPRPKLNQKQKKKKEDRLRTAYADDY